MGIKSIIKLMCYFCTEFAVWNHPGDAIVKIKCYLSTNTLKTMTVGLTVQTWYKIFTVKFTAMIITNVNIIMEIRDKEDRSISILR